MLRSKRVEKHTIKPSHPFHAEIDALCLASKNLYNTVLYTVRQSFFYGHGIPSWGQLHAYFKNSQAYKALPAKVAQLVIKQVSDAWTSYFASLKQWKLMPEKFTGRPSIPDYVEFRNLLKYNAQAYSRQALKQQRVLCPSMTQIEIPAPPVMTADNLCEIRLVPQVGCYVVEVVYEVEIPDLQSVPNPILPQRLAAIDLGLDNLMTVVFNDPTVRPFIINGKPLKSVNQWWNKQKAHLQSLLPVGQKTSHRIEAITRKRNCYVDHYLHCAAKTLVEQCQALGVSKVIIGKNPDWKREVNLGRINNQKFTAIPYNKLIDLCRYKLAAAGIELVVEEESFTSKASFLDWDSIPTYTPKGSNKHRFSGKRISRSWYKSQNGLCWGADINAGFNIGRKVVPNAFAHFEALVARDRGCPSFEEFFRVVVHPRRITPVCRANSRSAQALLKPKVA